MVTEDVMSSALLEPILAPQTTYGINSSVSVEAVCAVRGVDSRHHSNPRLPRFLCSQLLIIR